jgi:hypothetical protein
MSAHLSPISHYRASLFGSRDSVPEALEYVRDVANGSGRCGIAVYTAALVLLNTLIDEVERAELRAFEPSDWDQDIPF